MSYFRAPCSISADEQARGIACTSQFNTTELRVDRLYYMYIHVSMFNARACARACMRMRVRRGFQKSIVSRIRVRRKRDSRVEILELGALGSTKSRIRSDLVSDPFKFVISRDSRIQWQLASPDSFSETSRCHELPSIPGSADPLDS